MEISVCTVVCRRQDQYSVQLPGSTCENLAQEQEAIVWEGEPGEARTLTYHELHREVCTVIVWLERSISERESLIFLQAFRRVRRAYSRKTKLYIEMDNLPHHKDQGLLEYFSTNKIVAGVDADVFLLAKYYRTPF